MASGREPAAERSKRLLETVIQECHRTGNRVLPSIASMARDARVGTNVMWQAVERLRRDGRLESVQGSGTFVRAMTEVRPAAARRLSPEGRVRWQDASVRIRADILGGVFGSPALLPPAKSLCQRYGVCGQTLAKAISALIHDGLLLRDRRQLRAPGERARRVSATVVLFGWELPAMPLEARAPWGERFVQLLELECTRMGANLDVVAYFRDQGALVLRRRGRRVHPAALRDEAVQGYLIWGENPHQLLPELIGALAPLGRRSLAVMQEGTTIALPPSVSGNRRARVFSLATAENAGRRVAAYLLGLGHRRVAYISPYPEADWSRNRLAGLQAVLGSSVSQYVIPGARSMRHYEVMMRATEAGMERRIADELSRDMPSFARVVAAPTSVFLARALQDELTRRMCEPLFVRAAREQGVTAWVCANDRTALWALDYLRRQGLDGAISLVGFDNTIPSFRAGLTTYDFNVPATVRAMLGFVMAPESLLYRDSRGPIEVEGTIVQRRTVHVPKRAAVTRE